MQWLILEKTEINKIKIRFGGSCVKTRLYNRFYGWKSESWLYWMGLLFL